MRLAGPLQSKWMARLALVCASSVPCCVLPPELSEPVATDLPPFYFPDGLDPSPLQDVLLELGDDQRVELTASIFEFDPADTLEYEWRVVRGDASTTSSGILRNPVPIGDAFAYRVPTQTITSCGILLGQDGDTATVILTVTDPIPEALRLDVAADAYRIVVVWRVVARGNCD